ncbi:unnamed protein product [Withania somnifera]
MATTCERCSVLEKQKYWDEMDQHKSFFKIMTKDFRHRLCIPKKFVTCFKNSHKLLGQKILIGPSGDTWFVEVKKTEENDYIFCNGWEIFAKDHCLDDADMLVFKMDGFSDFDVLIYDASACEKEETFFVKKNRSPCKHPDEHTSEQQSSEDGHSNEEDDDTTDEEPTRRKSSRGKQYQFHSPQPSKGRRTKKILLATQDNRKRKCTPSSRKKNVEPEVKRPVFSNRRQVPEEKKIKVHQQAPQRLRCLRKKSETITLRSPLSRRTWEASVHCRMEGLVIQSGWEDFVMDNDLDEFDICVFELAQGGKHNSKAVILDSYVYPVENQIMRPL